MSERPDLFAEMDHVADVLRENDPSLRESLSDELQLEFRALQKRRMPELSKDEFLDLFDAWRCGYLARLEAELAALRRRMAENDRELAPLIAEQRRRNVRSHDATAQADDVFICRCGEIIADPFDPEQMRIHQPHVIAASLPQVHDALQRWRARNVR